MWLLWLLIAISGLFALGALLGAPYVPILKRSSHDLFELVDLRPGAKIIDLGSGDGAFALQAAKRGYQVIGYEINPILVAIARLRTLRYHKSIKIYLRDFWQVKLPEVDVIYVFLIERYMQKLEDKLMKEIKQPTVVVSHVFTFPHLKPIKRNQNTTVYKIN